MNKARLMQGNEAVAEGALAAGVLFYAGYPITPSTEIAEIMAERLPLVGGTFIQMEDEIASMAAIIGASLTGLKSLTATSGPGFSLKQENLGYALLRKFPVLWSTYKEGDPVRDYQQLLPKQTLCKPGGAPMATIRSSP